MIIEELYITSNQPLISLLSQEIEIPVIEKFSVILGFFWSFFDEFFQGTEAISTI